MSDGYYGKAAAMTKDQLLKEVVVLSERIAELEAELHDTDMNTNSYLKGFSEEQKKTKALTHRVRQLEEFVKEVKRVKKEYDEALDRGACDLPDETSTFYDAISAALNQTKGVKQ